MEISTTLCILWLSEAFTLLYMLWFISVNLTTLPGTSCKLQGQSVIQVDPYHTLFGLAGLSLLGHAGVRSVDPVFCMPTDVIQRLGVQYQTF